MRLRKHLSEMGFKLFKGSMIFVNPNKNEMVDMPFVRFIADGKLKRIYVWSATEGGVHQDVWVKVLKKSGSVYVNQGEEFVIGIASLKGVGMSGKFIQNIKKDNPWVFKSFSKLGFEVTDVWRA